jgi:hypothetical protein
MRIFFLVLLSTVTSTIFSQVTSNNPTKFITKEFRFNSVDGFNTVLSRGKWRKIDKVIYLDEAGTTLNICPAGQGSCEAIILTGMRQHGSNVWHEGYNNYNKSVKVTIDWGKRLLMVSYPGAAIEYRFTPLLDEQE